MSERAIQMPRELLAQIEELQTRIQQHFGKRLLGLYLYGSAVWGDFDPAISDVDLLAVLDSEVTETEIPALKSLHDGFVADYPDWDDRIEVQYFTPEGLAHFRERESPMANISPGEPLHLITSGHDWLSNWYFVQTYGITLQGPPPGHFIPYIGHDEFLGVVRTYADYWNEHVPENSASLPSQAYAILTMCRALYTLHTGEQVSKQKAAEWVAEQYPKEAKIIADALRWRAEFRQEQANAEAYAQRTEAFVRRMYRHIPE